MRINPLGYQETQNDLSHGRGSARQLPFVLSLLNWWNIILIVTTPTGDNEYHSLSSPLPSFSNFFRDIELGAS